MTTLQNGTEPTAADWDVLIAIIVRQQKIIERVEHAVVECPECRTQLSGGWTQPLGK